MISVTVFRVSSIKLTFVSRIFSFSLMSSFCTYRLTVFTAVLVFSGPGMLRSCNSLTTSISFSRWGT